MNEQLAKALCGQFDKALTPTTGAALIDDVVSPVISEEAFKNMAALQYAPITPNLQGDPFKFAVRSAMASAYPEGSSATPQTSGDNSTYAETSKEVKIVRSWGEFDNFVGSVSKANIARNEVLGCARSVGEQVCGQTFWGDELANEYSFDGFDPHTDLYVADGGAAAATTDMIDTMISATKQNGSQGLPRMLFMSPFLKMALSQYAIRTYKHDLAIQNVSYPRGDGGLQLAHWQGIPILEVDFTRPQAKASTTSATTTLYGGSIADGTYYVRVAPVTRYGEQLASDAVAVVISGGGGAAVITITLPAPFSHANINGAYGEAIYWKLYIGTAADNTPLVVTTNALSYDGNGTPTGYVQTVIYTGANTARRGAVGTATAGSEDQPLGGTLGVNPDEAVFLLLQDKNLGYEIPCSRYDDGTDIGYYDLLGFKRLAETKDASNFFVKSYVLNAIKWGATHAIGRRMRAA